VFPLADRYYYSYEDTWGAPRTQGGHEGTDLMAPAGAPEYAVTDGTVVPVAGSNENGWNSLGGYAVMVRADYSVEPVEEGDLFYYAHLGRPSPLKVGARVPRNQRLPTARTPGPPCRSPPSGNPPVESPRTPRSPSLRLQSKLKETNPRRSRLRRTYEACWSV